MNIDRQRVAAVQTLEAIGYRFDGGAWQGPASASYTAEADTMFAVLTEHADELIGCLEGSPENEVLQKLVAVLEVKMARSPEC